jgi:uncharacterized protein
LPRCRGVGSACRPGSQGRKPSSIVRGSPAVTVATCIDLHDLPMRGGERHEAVYALDVAPLMLGGAEFRVLLPHGADISVDRVAGGYLVSVCADARVYGPCARCLCDVALEVKAEEQEFAPTSGRSWDEADVSPFIEDLVVDVDALVREAVILALPGQVLCAPSCKGLCAQCGQELNVRDCECTALEISQQMG